MSQMFNCAIPLIYLSPPQRENREKHLLINVHWIKKEGGGDAIKWIGKTT